MRACHVGYIQLYKQGGYDTPGTRKNKHIMRRSSRCIQIPEDHSFLLIKSCVSVLQRETAAINIIIMKKLIISQTIFIVEAKFSAWTWSDFLCRQHADSTNRLALHSALHQIYHRSVTSGPVHMAAIWCQCDLHKCCSCVSPRLAAVFVNVYQRGRPPWSSEQEGGISANGKILTMKRGPKALKL